MAFNTVERCLERNVVRPTGNRAPGTRQFAHADNNVMGVGEQQGAHPAVLVAKSDRFEHTQRNKTSGDILSFSGEQASTGDLKVGRKPLEPTSHARRREHEYGVGAMKDVMGSDRYEHSQRNKTSGNILSHNATKADDVIHVGRARVETAPPPPQDDSKVKVGRGRTDLPPAIAAAETTLPFATAATPIEEPKKYTRHNNHYDHHDGLLTGGEMPRSTVKDKKPLWY